MNAERCVDCARYVPLVHNSKRCLRDYLLYLMEINTTEERIVNILASLPEWQRVNAKHELGEFFQRRRKRMQKIEGELKEFSDIRVILRLLRK